MWACLVAQWLYRPTGSSSQWLAVDHEAGRWSAGAYVNRVRWLHDVQTQLNYTIQGTGWCEHDVSLLGGLRGRLSGSWDTVTADCSTGWR